MSHPGRDMYPGPIIGWLIAAILLIVLIILVLDIAE